MAFSCRQPGDDEKMLFCDECDKGFHTYCLSPPMSSVPKTAWKCYVSFHFFIIFCSPNVCIGMDSYSNLNFLGGAYKATSCLKFMSRNCLYVVKREFTKPGWQRQLNWDFVYCKRILFAFHLAHKESWLTVGR